MDFTRRQGRKQHSQNNDEGVNQKEPFSFEEDEDLCLPPKKIKTLKTMSVAPSCPNNDIECPQDNRNISTTEMRVDEFHVLKPLKPNATFSCTEEKEFTQENLQVDKKDYIGTTLLPKSDNCFLTAMPNFGTDKTPFTFNAPTSENSPKREDNDIKATEHCRRLVYVYSPELIELCCHLPRIFLRAAMVHTLIEATGILKHVVCLSPRKAEENEITRFHSADYTSFLQRINHLADEEKVDADEAEQYGLSYDCPMQESVYDCAALVAGATLTAAEALCKGSCKIAINWCGGWHHAQRSSASGFCYINDIVLGISKLRESFSRILYVDLDLHHGDGVENAFCTTPHVLTVSLHKYAPGFFPGSGSISDVGLGKGKFYSVNVPLHDGIRDSEYFSIFKRSEQLCNVPRRGTLDYHLIRKKETCYKLLDCEHLPTTAALFERVLTCIQNNYRPQAIVCQCGADGLAGDPMSSFNLTSNALVSCVQFLLEWGQPTLLLGGGGYNHPNTARCWAALTAVAANYKLPDEVPDHKFYLQYSPDFEMCVQPGNRPDCNSEEYLDDICRQITVSPTPSALLRKWGWVIASSNIGDRIGEITESTHGRHYRCLPV